MFFSIGLAIEPGMDKNNWPLKTPRMRIYIYILTWRVYTHSKIPKHGKPKLFAFGKKENCLLFNSVQHPCIKHPLFARKALLFVDTQISKTKSNLKWHYRGRRGGMQQTNSNAKKKKAKSQIEVESKS